MRVHNTVLSCVACPAVKYISTLPHNDTIEKKKLNIKFVFWFYLQILFQTFLILRRIERDKKKKCIHIHVKYTLFLK